MKHRSHKLLVPYLLCKYTELQLPELPSQNCSKQNISVFQKEIIKTLTLAEDREAGEGKNNEIKQYFTFCITKTAQRL